MAKFLILRFSSIGDIVLTTPVIRCLKKQVAGSEIHFATKKVFEPVIEHNPYIDKKFFLEDNLDLFISLLKTEKYDYIIDLHNNIRTLIIKKKLGVKNYSFHKLNFEKWLMVNFKINLLPKKHIVDRNLETVSSFGVVNDGGGLDYYISPEDEKAIQRLPSTHQHSYIGFVIGAKHATKRLPIEKIISICNKIKGTIVLLGGKEDDERAVSICNASPNCFNACGIFTINESAALVKHASKIITHDTGLMHIAAAFKKEIVSVWGNTIPEFGMSPYYRTGNAGPGTILEVKNLSCRPCTKLGFEKCPKGHFKCMKEIDEGTIESTANKI